MGLFLKLIDRLTKITHKFNMNMNTLGMVLVLALMHTAFADRYLDSKRIEARFRRKMRAFKSSRRRLVSVKDIHRNEQLEVKFPIGTTDGRGSNECLLPGCIVTVKEID